MGVLRCSPVSAAALLVYLFASVAGGLHHHGEEAQPAPSAATGAAFDRAEGQATADDQPHACVVCTSLHQAKTPPASISLLITPARATESAITSAPVRAFSVRASTHARAPPAV